MRQRDRERAQAWQAINRLRQQYRMGQGLESTLREEIIRQSAACDYDHTANDALFTRVDAITCGPIGSGFGCWLRD